jgi:GGDEF domain-containing protein
LDRFKQINDRYGHATGDAVLRRLGELMKRSALLPRGDAKGERSSADAPNVATASLTLSLRGDDVVSRWGGDEFVIGMYGMTEREGQERLMEVLETLRLEEFTAPDHTKFRVTFSAGVAQSPEDGTDLQSLYRLADAALYQAKKAGRDRVLRSGSIMK